MYNPSLWSPLFDICLPSQEINDEKSKLNPLGYSSLNKNSEKNKENTYGWTKQQCWFFFHFSFSRPIQQQVYAVFAMALSIEFTHDSGVSIRIDT